MDKDSLAFMQQTIHQYTEIPLPEWEKLAGMLNPLHLEKNVFFVRQEDKPLHLAFIISGIFRIFCITESGDEKTLAFRSKGQFLSAFTPYLENRTAWYSIQALTPANLIYFSLENKNLSVLNHPCWDRLVKEYVVKLFIEKEDRERSFLTEDAKTRYLRFREKHPDLEQEIHQFYIASFLGISPVSLSRIRADLKNRC